MSLFGRLAVNLQYGAVGWGGFHYGGGLLPFALKMNSDINRGLVEFYVCFFSLVASGIPGFPGVCEDKVPDDHMENSIG